MTGDLSVPAPQPNPSADDGWVRFYFDDADPVAECVCGWHTHGDSASDAFGTWWKHRREHGEACDHDPGSVAHEALVAEVRRLREETEKWRDRMTEHSDCEHRNAAELRRLHAEADSLRRQLLSETYRPEGVEIVMRELGIVKRERDAAVAEAARVREALQAVRDLHVAGRCGCDPNSPHSTGHCRVCGIKAGWPCATVRALDAALDGAE